MNARLFIAMSFCLSAARVLAQTSQDAGPESFDLEGALLSSDTRAFTADEAGQRARVRSPQIASAEAAADSAHEDSEVQRSQFLPTLTGQAAYVRYSKVTSAPFGNLMIPGIDASAFPPFTLPENSYQLSANLRFPVSDLFLRVWPAYSATKNIAAARELEIESKRAGVDLTAREAFYAHARALATMVVAEQALKQAEAQAQQTKLFVDAGTAAPVDLMTATARVESMRSALARAKGAVAITRNTLAVYTGIKTSEIVGIKEPVTSLPEAPKADVEALLASGLERRPELRAIRKLVEANTQQRSAERAAALPSLSLDGTVLYANPNPRYIPIIEKFKTTWQVGASLAWSPNSVLVGHHRGRKFAAETEKAMADLAALEDAVRIEVVQAYEDYHAADAAARSSEAQQRAAEETYRVRLATYRVGAGVQIDLLAADLALTQARLDYVNAVIDARISLARLARATGEPR